jgi:hypothetical protein
VFYPFTSYVGQINYTTRPVDGAIISSYGVLNDTLLARLNNLHQKCQLTNKECYSLLGMLNGSLLRVVDGGLLWLSIGCPLVFSDTLLFPHLHLTI